MASWAHHWLYQDFWCLIWPNAGAVPLCALVSAIGIYVFRERIGRRLTAFWHRHQAEHLARLEKEKFK
jgi:hypothetical protein